MFNFLKKRKIVLKIVPTLVVLVILPTVFGIGAVIPNNTAYAQGRLDVIDGRQPLPTTPTPAPVRPPPSNATLTDEELAALESRNACGFTNPIPCIQYGGLQIVYGISVILLMMGAWVLWVGGGLLDTVLGYTIVEMSTHLSSTDGLGIAITESWRAIRDLANIGFIFILLYVAIGTILGLGNVDMKRMLTRVIIVALLLNFSLFFTKLAIDASNATTVVFYNSILKTNPHIEKGNGGGVSGAFMDKFGLTSLWSAGTAGQIIGGSDKHFVGPNGENLGQVMLNDWEKMLMLGFFGFIFMIVAAFVFFATAILFIQRFVALVFILVLSPVAFASMALPNDKFSGPWWKSLWNQLIFAPACIAMMWVTLKLLAGINKNINIKGIGGAIVGDGGTAIPGAGAVIMNYIIVIAFMIGVLVVAKETGSSGASGMLKLGKKWRGNLTSFVGRNTIGRAAARIDKDLAETNIGRGYLARYGTDSRAGRWVRSLTTGAVAESKFGGDLSRKTDKARIDVIKKDVANAEKRRDDRRKMEEAQGNIRSELSDDARYTMTQAQIDAHDTARESEEQRVMQLFSKMSNAELENLGASEIEKNIRYLNPKQLEHILEKSDKFNEREKTKMREARFKPIEDAVAAITNEARDLAGLATIANPVKRTEEENKLKEKIKKEKKRIANLTAKEIELSGSELIGNAQFVESLSQNQIDSLTKADNLSLTSLQKQKLKDLFKAPIERAFNPASATYSVTARVAAIAEAVKAIKKMDAKNVAKLKIDILRDPAVIESYTISKLTKIAEQMEDTNDTDALRLAIETQAAIIGIGASPNAQTLNRWLQTPTGQQVL